jgi:quercetin dioxygenase-like cupin family protein
MAANVQQSTDNYFTVKSIETVLEAADVKARIFTLAPSDVIPWHYHCDITDHFFALSGKLTIETRMPEDRRTLTVGERYKITATKPHMVSNRGTTDCQFLLLQGVGRYDFQKISGEVAADEG